MVTVRLSGTKALWGTCVGRESDGTDRKTTTNHSQNKNKHFIKPVRLKVKLNFLTNIGFLWPLAVSNKVLQSGLC